MGDNPHPPVKIEGEGMRDAGYGTPRGEGAENATDTSPGGGSVVEGSSASKTRKITHEVTFS